MGRVKSLFAYLIVAFAFNASAQQLVLPGDHPDPSVVKIGDTYWASATTSNWFPAFPLIKSKDLKKWETVGHVFNKKPDWADYYFWAPEISYENGKVYIYYSAHKKDGNLCVGVASADKPEGPYTDHGPIMCQEVGSIDGFPMRDENGKLYLVWKEDANSVGKPTPIWAMQMNEERTALIGEKKELFRNDLPWEANLVEGVSMIRHGGYFYSFYASAGCCGTGCTYASGVARSKSLLGPWEKYEKNPVLTSNNEWKCPGHGTPVEKDGKHYFLYHGYNAKSSAYTGREGLLIEFKFTPDGWVKMEMQQSPPAESAVSESINDEFKGKSLSNRWHWSVFQDVDLKLRNGKLWLSALPLTSGAFLGQSTLTGNYSAETVILKNKSTAEAGLAAIGDDKNLISASVKDNLLRLQVLKDDKPVFLSEKTINSSKKVWLQMKVRNSTQISFLYSTDGEKYQVLNEKPIDGTYLPPWDRAVRVGLISKGTSNETAVFDRFEIRPF